MIKKIASVLLLVLSGCTFRAPTVQDQQALVQRGTFPSGNPEWIYTPTGASKGYGMGGGFFNLDGGGDYKEVSNRFNTNKVILNANDANKELAASRIKVEEKKELSKDIVPKGPLDQIHAVCPNEETAVNDALTTIEIPARILKYENLTKKCDQSADLWFWLAQDYEKNGDLVKANRSYEKALVASPSMNEAELGTARVKKMMVEMGKLKVK